MLSCVIVDDEALARKRIQYLLSRHTRHISVKAEFDTAQDVLVYLENNSVDILFLDIGMPGLSGIDALDQVPSSVYVVFTTAYKEFAIEAFEKDASDYLLKPISQERFDKAIFKFQLKGGGAHQKPIDITTNIKQLNRVAVRTKEGVIFVDLDEVLYAKASEKYVELLTTSGQRYVIDQTLTDLENVMNDLLRIHKSLVVNQRHIKEIKKHFNARYKVILSDKDSTELVSGRSYSAAIKSVLGLR